MTKDIENVLTAAGLLAAACAIEFALACARGWLLSLTVALFAPAVVLSFWQWVFVALTIRFMLANLDSSKK
jgi:hypothetical protein